MSELDAAAPAATDDSPYVGLSYFTEDRADLFFGRDAERTTITGNLRASRLTLLYAESGVGKSSLLRAGVAARLRDLARRSAAREGTLRYIPVVFSSWRDDPMPELIDAIESAIEPFVAQGAKAEPRRDGLEAACESASTRTGATLLVILDQFEEYFLYGSREASPGRLADELARCVNRPEVRAHFLIAVREDAYAGVGDLFKGRIVNVYGNFLHLEYLDRRSARAAITGPIEHYNSVHGSDQAVAVEPELVHAVLDQVRKGKVVFERQGQGAVAGAESGIPGAERIETPYLQLVMTTLWEHELAAGSRVLRRSTLDQLGGAQEIVHAHLDKALNDLPDDERETAVEVFHHLVTPSGTKIVHRIADLAAYARRPPAEVEKLVEKLAGGKQRILRPVPAPPGDEDGSSRVEIFHDVLAPAILAWRSRQTAVRLERETRDAQAHAARERTRARVSIGLAAVACAALIVAIVAFAQARSETDRALRAQRISISYELARQALTELQSGALAPGVLLSIEAYRYADTPDARYGLVRALAATQAMQGMFPGYSAAVTSVSFSPDGKLLATGDASGTVVIQDESTGRRLATLPGSSSINEVAFSPDGTMLAAATQAGTVVLWSVAMRQAVRTLDGHAGAVNGIAFSPDGKTIAAADADHTVVVFDSATGRPVRTLRGHHAAVEDVKFSPDGRMLASGGDDRTVILWASATGRRLRTLTGHTAAVTAVAFAPDGRTLASAGDDHTIVEWSTITGRELAVLRAHSAFIDDIAFSPDGSTIASAGDDHLVTLWNARTGQELRVLRGHAAAVDSVAFNPSGTLLASSGQDDLVIQWYARPQLLERTLTGDTNAVLGTAVSPDGRLVASAGEDGLVRVWDAGTGALLHTLRGHTDAVEDVAFSPDSRTLVSAGADKTLIVWDADTGQRLRTLRGHTDIVYGVAFSPDDHTIASASADDSVILWNADTGQRLHTLLGHSDVVNAVAFSPDGKLLASAASDKSIILWDVATGRRVRTLTGHTAAIESVAFSPNGRELASASLDGTVMLWSVPTGRPLGDPLRGHSGGVTSVAFSPRGRTLASGGVDDSVIVWDLATRLGEPYVAQNGPIAGIAFTPGGRAVISGAFDGTVAEAGPVPQAITASRVDERLCGVARRSLTRAEWKALVPGQAYQRTCPGRPS